MSSDHPNPRVNPHSAALKAYLARHSALHTTSRRQKFKSLLDIDPIRSAIFEQLDDAGLVKMMLVTRQDTKDLVKLLSGERRVDCISTLLQKCERFWSKSPHRDLYYSSVSKIIINDTENDRFAIEFRWSQVTLELFAIFPNLQTIEGLGDMGRHEAVGTYDTMWRVQRLSVRPQSASGSGIVEQTITREVTSIEVDMIFNDLFGPRVLSVLQSAADGKVPNLEDGVGLPSLYEMDKVGLLTEINLKEFGNNKVRVKGFELSWNDIPMAVKLLKCVPFLSRGVFTPTVTANRLPYYLPLCSNLTSLTIQYKISHDVAEIIVTNCKLLEFLSVGAKSATGYLREDPRDMGAVTMLKMARGKLPFLKRLEFPAAITGDKKEAPVPVPSIQSDRARSQTTPTNITTLLKDLPVFESLHLIPPGYEVYSSPRLYLSLLRYYVPPTAAISFGPIMPVVRPIYVPHSENVKWRDFLAKDQAWKEFGKALGKTWETYRTDFKKGIGRGRLEDRKTKKGWRMEREKTAQLAEGEAGEPQQME